MLTRISQHPVRITADVNFSFPPHPTVTLHTLFQLLLDGRINSQFPAPPTPSVKVNLHNPVTAGAPKTTFFVNYKHVIFRNVRRKPPTASESCETKRRGQSLASILDSRRWCNWLSLYEINVWTACTPVLLTRRSRTNLCRYYETRSNQFRPTGSCPSEKPAQTQADS